jgi:hypothetical protein
MELTRTPVGRDAAGEPGRARPGRFVPALALGVGLITLAALQATVGADGPAPTAADSLPPAATQHVPRLDETSRPPLEPASLPPAAEAVLPDHDRELLSYAPHGG